MIDFKELEEKELTLYIDGIKLEPLKEFVTAAVCNHSTITKLKKANKVADIVWQRFEHAGYVTEHTQQQFVDITIAAALLHNLFFKEDDITTLLAHRVKLAYITHSMQIDERLLELVYEVIEGQLGETSPVQKLKPIPNSPASTFAEAVWQVNVYKSRL